MNQHMRKVLTIIMLSSLLLVSCGRKSGSGGASVRDFPQVQVPAVVGGQEEAMEYLTLHYWDAFTAGEGNWLCDSLHIAGVEATALEAEVGKYTTLLSMLPLETARKDVRAFCSRLEQAQRKDNGSNIFDGTLKMVSRYLYDPNSPVRNEDIYGALALSLSESDCVGPDERERFAREAELCSRNAVGTVAADFSFICRDGREMNLHSVKAPLTLLFFSNPGCPACAEISRTLTDDPKVNSLLGDGTLAVVSIYIDEEIDEWMAHTGDWPAQWTVGYDPAMVIRNSEIYVVRAIPSLYLLDSEKRVIMKDAVAEKLVQWLQSYENQ